ncbi:vitamin K epoxide reductase family protein [Actinocorallia lasiicapitis]
MTATLLADGPAPARPSADRGTAWLITLTGALGLLASAILTLDKLRLLEDPGYTPSCNISPILSCGSVMRTAQASAFGFPNSLIGLAAFTTVLTIGVVLLTGAHLPRWFWAAFTLGSAAGLVFVHWLIFQTLYRIDAICPYCTAVWLATVVLTVTLAVRLWTLPPRLRWLVPLLWSAAVALLALNRFWYYWQTLL